MPLSDMFAEVVKVFEVRVETPKIVYLDSGPDCVVDGSIVYQVDIFNDEFWNELVRVFELVT